VSSSSAGTVATLPELERVAGHVHAALRLSMQAQALTMPGGPPEEAAWATDRAAEASEEAGAALALLGRLGVRPAVVPAQSEPIPLRQMNTPDVRALLELLRQAVPIAERVDKARGRVVSPTFPLGDGETAGFDLAETLQNIVLRLEGEAFGPADLRQAGRE